MAKGKKYFFDIQLEILSKSQNLLTVDNEMIPVLIACFDEMSQKEKNEFVTDIINREIKNKQTPMSKKQRGGVRSYKMLSAIKLKHFFFKMFIVTVCLTFLITFFTAKKETLEYICKNKILNPIGLSDKAIIKYMEED